MNKKSEPFHPNTKQDGNNIKPGTEANIVSVINATVDSVHKFTKLLKPSLADTDIAFILLLQHLNPKHISLLPELKAHTTVTGNFTLKPSRIAQKLTQLKQPGIKLRLLVKHPIPVNIALSNL